MILSQDDIQLLKACVEFVDLSMIEGDTATNINKLETLHNKLETLHKKLSLIQQPIYIEEK